MKRVMVIGGGEWQVPLVKKAKELGYFVICSNLYSDSPAFEYADISCVANVLDKEKNLEFAEQFKPDAVVTDQSDIAVSTVAYICKKLNLPGIGEVAAACFTKKHFMRRIMMEHGLPTPAFQLCQSVDEAKVFIRQNGLPVVMKPPASQSSRGVTKVENSDAVDEAFELAKQFSEDGSVLIEDFIGGMELTVDGIKTHDRHYCLATSCKEHYAANPMVASRLLFLQSHPAINYKELHALHDSLIAAMNLPFGLTHAEYKYHEGKFYLIEVAARGGGTRLSSDIVPLMSDIDNTALLLRMALGELLHKIEPNYPTRVAVMEFFDFVPGKVNRIEGVEAAKEVYGVVDIGLTVKPGDQILPVADDRTRHGHIIAWANDMEGLNTILTAVKERVKISYA